MLNIKILDILVCPLCKGSLNYQQDTEELICEFDHLAYLIHDDAPIMLIDEARQLVTDEL
jgi:uncharacterized protein YbaR (Trm112 family)